MEISTDRKCESEQHPMRTDSKWNLEGTCGNNLSKFLPTDVPGSPGSSDFYHQKGYPCGQPFLYI